MVMETLPRSIIRIIRIIRIRPCISLRERAATVRTPQRPLWSLKDVQPGPRTSYDAPTATRQRPAVAGRRQKPQKERNASQGLCSRSDDVGEGELASVGLEDRVRGVVGEVRVGIDVPKRQVEEDAHLSEAIRGNQRQSEASGRRGRAPVRGNQRQSEAIRSVR